MTVYHGKDATIELVDNSGTSSIGFATSFSFDITSNTEAQYYIGSRKVREYERGNLEITGSLERYYIDNDYIGKTLGTASLPLTEEGTALTDYQIKGTVTDSSNNTKQITLTGLVFTDDSLDFTSDDITTESLDFQARDIQTA